MTLEEAVQEIGRIIPCSLNEEHGARIAGVVSGYATQRAGEAEEKRQEDKLVHEHILRVHGIDYGCMSPKDISGCLAGCTCSCHARKTATIAECRAALQEPS